MVTKLTDLLKNIDDAESEWISVADKLPEKDTWVQVFEDDEDNLQDSFIGKMCGTFRRRVTPARLLSIDSDGYADWYLCFIGGGSTKHVRNVTHWKPMSNPPNTQHDSRLITQLQDDRENLIKFIINTNHAFDENQIISWLDSKRKLKELS